MPTGLPSLPNHCHVSSLDGSILVGEPTHASAVKVNGTNAYFAPAPPSERTPSKPSIAAPLGGPTLRRVWSSTGEYETHYKRVAKTSNAIFGFLTSSMVRFATLLVLAPSTRLGYLNGVLLRVEGMET